MLTAQRPVAPPTNPVAPQPAQQPAPVPGGVVPNGAQRWAPHYFDERGVRHRARDQVPVDQYGRLAGHPYACRKCRTTRWFPLGLKGTPVCEVHNLRMATAVLRGPALLPWRDLWRTTEPYLRPVWPFAAAIPAAVAAHQQHVPVWALSAGALVAAEAARRRTGLWLARRRPEVRVHTRRRRARTVGYGVLAGGGWLAAATATGLDLNSVGGTVAAGLLPAVVAGAAAPWWRWVTEQRNRPVPLPETPPAPPGMDPDEAAVRRKWAQILAVEQGDPAGHDAAGNPAVAKRPGKLAGTWLEGWHRVEGGWAATAVGPPGAYTSESFLAARGAIASTFQMKAHMVTIIPDEDDENRALISTQRTTPITDVVRWAGPDSIHVAEGQTWRAPIAQYKDTALADYELFRWGWGTPHDFLCGTTGAGKSESLSLLLLIDRWAHYTDPNGVDRGLVADLLIDPQQGQSYGPFLDDLAAPVACSLEEATLLVKALKAEMLRRNRYLARIRWTDERGRQRKGRKCWNPLIDGPIITLNIDEAHEYLADRAFAALVTSGARMYRKCGIRIRVATHTPLLADLGGSMALRDMLTGGFVWVGRTANSLSGPVAFNGRLQVDPRTIPEVAGMAFLLSGLSPKPMLARSMWEPDFYDWIRDDADAPIGYPAALPPETLAAFGPGYAKWVAHMADPEAGLWTPDADKEPAESASNPRSVDAVLLVLGKADHPQSMDELDAELRRAGLQFTTRTVREALAKLRKVDPPLVASNEGRHELTARGMEEALTRAELVNA